MFVIFCLEIKLMVRISLNLYGWLEWLKPLVSNLERIGLNPLTSHRPWKLYQVWGQTWFIHMKSWGIFNKGKQMGGMAFTSPFLSLSICQKCIFNKFEV